MHIEFTQADDSHIEALVELVNSAYRGDSSKQGWTTEADLLGGQRIDTLGIIELLKKEDSVILVGEDEENDDQLMACVHLEKQEDKCHLGMLTVSPLGQKKGIGEMLLEEAQAFADFWDCRCLEIEVIKQREELINWYLKKGFKLTGKTKPFPYGDERFGIPKRDDLEFIVMEKAL